jgi:hypothetical protein
VYVPGATPVIVYFPCSLVTAPNVVLGIVTWALAIGRPASPNTVPVIRLAVCARAAAGAATASAAPSASAARSQSCRGRAMIDRRRNVVRKVLPSAEAEWMDGLA